MNRLLACMLLAVCAAPPAPAKAGGDAVRGKQLYSAHCMACHSADVSMAGPAHRGVFGRKAGSVADFAYSPALKRSGIVWDAGTLDRWLSDPEKLVPGQAMNYSVADAQARADLIAYLRTLQPAAAAPPRR
ncbi:c-type cytochrome [Pseudoduganella sp. LjRoot289]|uniref:c-type cytochrome n=1 Tax=Pseudoduganella sp. LjRoot289 TaxID=3342314 RepID=UPI003ECD1033